MIPRLFWTTVRVALALALSAPGAGVKAGLIDFNTDANGNPIDAPAHFSGATHLTELYAPLGVYFSGPTRDDGGAILTDTDYPVKALSGSNFLAFGRGDRLSDGGTPTDPETITFDQPQSNVSISVTPEATIPSLFRLQAFDSQGRQVATNSVIFGEGFGFYQTLKVSSPLGIKQITLAQILPLGSPSFVIDNLSSTAIADPEPSAITLFGLGLGGLFGYACHRLSHPPDRPRRTAATTGPTPRTGRGCHPRCFRCSIQAQHQATPQAVH